MHKMEWWNYIECYRWLNHERDNSLTVSLQRCFYRTSTSNSQIMHMDVMLEIRKKTLFFFQHMSRQQYWCGLSNCTHFCPYTQKIEHLKVHIIKLETLSFNNLRNKRKGRQNKYSENVVVISVVEDIFFSKLQLYQITNLG